MERHQDKFVNNLVQPCHRLLPCSQCFERNPILGSGRGVTRKFQYLLHVVGVHLVADGERKADEECHGDDGKALPTEGSLRPCGELGVSAREQLGLPRARKPVDA